MDEASKSSALAGAIVAMSRSLGIETIAEGIETEEQAVRMRSVGCAFGQGYAFAAPLTPTELLGMFGPGAAARPAGDGADTGAVAKRGVTSRVPRLTRGTQPAQA